MSIFEVWKTSKTKGLKVRYLGWTQIRYLSIVTVDYDKMKVYGYLDNGEAASYSFNSDHFEIYYHGAENNNILV